VIEWKLVFEWSLVVQLQLHLMGVLAALEYWLDLD